MFLHSCVHVLTENNERFLISKKILHLSMEYSYHIGRVIGLRVRREREGVDMH